MGGGEFGVLDEEVLNGGVFTESFQVDVYFVASLFQFFFPFPGNVVFGVVAGNEHEGNEGDFLGLGGFKFPDNVIERGIALDRPDVVVLVAAGFHDVVEHAVGGVGRVVGAVADEDSVAFGFFEGGSDGFYRGLVVVGSVQEGVAETYVLEFGAVEVDFLA